MRTLSGDAKPVKQLHLSPEFPAQHLLVVSGTDTELACRLHDLSHESPPRLLQSVKTAVEPLQQFTGFSPDGKLLALAGSELVLYNLADGTERSLGAPDLGTIACLAFSADGRLLATAGQKPFIWIWEVQSGVRRQPLKTDSSMWTSSVAFGRDGRTLLSGDDNNLTRFWNIALGKEIFRISRYWPMERGQWFSPRGNALALLTAKNLRSAGVVELYTVPTLEEIDATEMVRAERILQVQEPATPEGGSMRPLAVRNDSGDTNGVSK